MSFDPPRRSSLHGVKIAVVLALAGTLTLSGSPSVSNAQDPKKSNVASLEGAWSGAGTVSFASAGLSRSAAEHASTGQASTAIQSMPSASHGRWQNCPNRQGASTQQQQILWQFYSISGLIVVHGSSQTVRLTSDAGSGILNLSR